MAKIIDKLIEDCQHAFVGGRQILDAELIDNEVVDKLVNSKMEGKLCNLDMKKAYDRVN